MRLIVAGPLGRAGVHPRGHRRRGREEPMMPDLKAKEWKKLGEAGLEIWDVKEGKGDAVKAGAKSRSTTPAG